MSSKNLVLAEINFKSCHTKCGRDIYVKVIYHPSIARVIPSTRRTIIMQLLISKTKFQQCFVFFVLKLEKIITVIIFSRCVYVIILRRSIGVNGQFQQVKILVVVSM